jgi:hypothetical protein
VIVRTPRLAFEGREAVLRSRIEFADAGRPAFELRLAVSDAAPGMVDGSANGVLPLAGLVAGRLGEDLAVEGTASPRLLEGCEAAAGIFADWWGYRVPAITCEAPAAAPWAGEGVGIFYTRGVDTSATLVRSLDGEIPERVTHLVSGEAIEWAFSDDVQREIWAGTERAARDLGLPLVRLRSNARELLRGLIGWPRAFGAAYVSPALLIGPAFGTLLTGATQPMVGSEPRGSRWDLDPLWSTEATVIRQDAAELSRAERVAILVRNETALRALKVCWEGREAGNCGRCIKCLRTMTALAILGRLDDGLFDAPLSPAAVRSAPIANLTAKTVAAFTPAVPESMPELRAAWEDKIAQAERAERSAERRRLRRRRLRRLRRRVRRALGASPRSSARGRGRAPGRSPRAGRRRP